ncbi:predicted protein [Nematostella vectensis]|uniref:PDZ domain-containing protein n=1 Tax=Nematostella vectensis TaxID=45351 RepID=A7SNC4_NEMVE|nr:predicted protein [Nematostella vectensis]|eukprot:XP_001626928.1 predicted protein [Nematostella vectensis]
MDTMPQQIGSVQYTGRPPQYTGSPHKYTSTQYTDYSAEEQPFEVHLIKGPQGLGMSLTGGESGGPIYIKRLVPGGSAALCGQLQVNDVILQVNGKSLDRLTYREALSILRNCPPEVRLLVKRSRGSSYPPYPGYRGSTASSYAGSYAGSYGSMSSLS